MQVEIAASSDPVDEADGAFRAESLRKAITTLGGDLRRAVELYYFAGLSVDETAKVLGVGGEAVKSRLFRARKALRKYLEKAEEGHPSIEMESRESRAR
jgi:RNA polymerase sigma-70 factor (ECF subfamily)